MHLQNALFKVFGLAKYHSSDGHIKDCLLVCPPIESEMVLVQITLKPLLGAMMVNASELPFDIHNTYMQLRKTLAFVRRYLDKFGIFSFFGILVDFPVKELTK